jgi:hypothetical protein
MADYKNPRFLTQNNHSAFDATHHAGALAPYSGIYRCAVCGHEAVSTQGHTLPPQTHHTHPNRTAIAWQLIVASTHP